MYFKEFSFVLSVLVLGIMIFPSRVEAASTYIPLSEGYDISFPQCLSPYPSDPNNVWIIGVNNGKAFTLNTCFLSEYLSVSSASSAGSVYVNLNAPSGRSRHFANNGPIGRCSGEDAKCHAYTYGFNAAKYDFILVTMQFIHPVFWWIDIETANTWSDNFLQNALVLQGAIDFFTSVHAQSGIYSTKHEWNAVMGDSIQPFQALLSPFPLLSFTSAPPTWVGGGDETALLDDCKRSFLLYSKIWLVQYMKNEFDGDTVCP